MSPAKGPKSAKTVKVCTECHTTMMVKGSRVTDPNQGGGSAEVCRGICGCHAWAMRSLPHGKGEGIPGKKVGGETADLPRGIPLDRSGMGLERTAPILPDLPPGASLHEGSDSYDYSSAKEAEGRRPCLSFWTWPRAGTGGDGRDRANVPAREKGTLKQRILIIDDEPDLLMYLKTFLEDQGFEVSCAEDVRRHCR